MVGLTPDQQELVRSHLHVARRVSRAYGRRSPHLADLIESAAMVGLCAAAGAYVPERGDFGVYAYKQVRGHVIDEVRRWNNGRRVMRDGRWTLWFPSARVYSGWVGAEVDPLTEVPEDPAVEPSGRFEELLRLISAASRGVLSLIYGEGKTVGEAAVIWGVSTSRASQRHMSALAELREALGEVPSA